MKKIANKSIPLFQLEQSHLEGRYRSVEYTHMIVNGYEVGYLLGVKSGHRAGGRHGLEVLCAGHLARPFCQFADWRSMNFWVFIPSMKA